MHSQDVAEAKVKVVMQAVQVLGLEQAVQYETAVEHSMHEPPERYWVDEQLQFVEEY